MKAPLQTANSGLTFVELLVTLVVGAGLIAAAVIGFSTVAGAPTRGGRVDVAITPANHNTLYGVTNNFVTIGQNPNYFQAAQARRMKDRLMSDAAAGTAVFVLGRNQLGGVRPASIDVSTNDFRNVTTPAAFRGLLVDANAQWASVFPAAQSGALTTTNASIFIVRGLDSITGSANTLRMVATYEVDFLPTASPSGTYASVRRYGTNAVVPTDYYHVFYPGDANTTNPFRPLGAFFERSAQAVGDPAADLFRVAPNGAFSFVWWPDPLVSHLSGRPVLTGTAGTPRAEYANMARRTSLFFVLPAFPGQ